MLNSKFDINSPEWIDRVFENRNKSYGAYDLRKHYAGNLFKAFAITILSIAAVVAVASFMMDAKPETVALNKGAVDVNNKPIDIVSSTASKKTSTTQTKTTAIPSTGNAQPVSPIDVKEVEVKPSPFGGATAWARFLETNLHYPAEAREQRLAGSVLMSFVVERDGHISDITVDQPAGHGFDEEALRVLKLSPAWTVGKLNGQSVRVKYNLPINFRIERR